MMKVLDQATGRDWVLYHGDSMEVLRGIPDNSLHYGITSPPFSALYTYSNSVRDAGNCRGDDEFFEGFQFLIKELYRILMPGRLFSLHCMNLPSTIQNNGYIGIRDFRGDLIRAFQSEGFIYHSEVCIWKDPVTAMQRTKAIGLLHKQLVKDSSLSRQGIPDYLVTMRKPGSNPEPISGELQYFAGEGALSDPKQRYEKALAEWREYQNILKSGDEDRRWEWEDCGGITEKPVLQNFIREDKTRNSINIWQRYASPVWMDIDPSDTLQYQSARDNGDERHVCPLQLQVIERAMQLWSNPGDVVIDPFNGIASTGHVALRTSRKYVGIELKKSYFDCSVVNMRNAESQQQDLFSHAGVAV